MMNHSGAKMVSQESAPQLITQSQCLSTRRLHQVSLDRFHFSHSQILHWSLPRKAPRSGKDLSSKQPLTVSDRRLPNLFITLNKIGAPTAGLGEAAWHTMHREFSHLTAACSGNRPE